jgi:hypothetical protein
MRYGIVDGMNVCDSRVYNYAPRRNGAPSQDLLVIRRNHQTGEVSLDPLQDPKGGRKPINVTNLRLLDRAAGVSGGIATLPGLGELKVRLSLLGHQLKPHGRGNLKRQSFPTWHNCNGQRNSTERALR